LKFCHFSQGCPSRINKKYSSKGTTRRIILTTNIAETSLTVPGIKYVIDAGLARIVRYNPRLKIEQLLIEKISQASANQRSGRCGRIAPGVCIRLYDEEDFDLRPYLSPIQKL
jgi:ATP-dependent helicase HrpA